MADKGFFLISDITGYTSFLTQSELEHAQHILEALFNCQLKIISSPLKVSNFQGDAIFCYAPDNSNETGIQTFSQAAKLYQAFRAKIAEMQIDPPCHCKVCSTIDLLDLKIFLHYGEYLVKKLGDREELVGADVILAHRMMKNKVTEKTRIKSYLLISKAAFSLLDFNGAEVNFLSYEDFYEHIGKVKMHVVDLNGI
jgi:class 3 adenylate cyclase